MKCWACLEAKPVAEFYPSRVKRDGTGKCKACVCADVAANRSANLDHYRSRDRARAFDPDRVALRQRVRETRRADPDKKAADDQGKREWIARNRAKRAAHVELSNAVRDGLLIPAEVCERCGSSGPLHGHHEDYDKSLDVFWLCRRCHGRRHREINQQRREQRTQL